LKESITWFRGEKAKHAKAVNRIELWSTLRINGLYSRRGNATTRSFPVNWGGTEKWGRIILPSEGTDFAPGLRYGSSTRRERVKVKRRYFPRRGGNLLMIGAGAQFSTTTGLMRSEKHGSIRHSKKRGFPCKGEPLALYFGVTMT